MARRKKKRRAAPPADGLSPAERAARSKAAARTKAGARMQAPLAGLADIALPRKRPTPKEVQAESKPTTSSVPKSSTERAPEPPVPYEEADRIAFAHAFAGVTPLGATAGQRRRKKQSLPTAPSPEEARREAARARAEAAERQARARLDALVAGGVAIEVRHNDDGGVEGWRRACPDRTLQMLARGELAPEAHLDLHGLRQREVPAALNRFVRKSHREGRRTLALIHGKGSHSEGGRGVLRSALVRALAHGGAAPLVECFVTAPTRHGGHGVLLLRLRNRFR